MIKFFRKIRQRLLTENKFSKYIIYAFGEIILVVIGILIALGINNWNENRKLRSQEITYLKNLKNDLRTQIEMLDVYIDYETIIIDQSNDIIEHYNRNNGFKEMDSIFPKLHDLSTRWTFSNANSTLIQMLNSNQINILQNEKLKTELIAFNQQIELFTTNTNTNNSNLVDNFTTQTFIEKGTFATYGVSEKMLGKFTDFYPFEVNKVNDSELNEIATNYLNKPENRLELINKVVYRNTISTLQKSGNQSIKNRAKEILSSIEKEIKIRN